MRAFLAILLFLTTTAKARAWVDYVGTVEGVLTYSTSPKFYIRLVNQPTVAPSGLMCDPGLFAVAETDGNEETRQRLYSAAQSALVSQREVTISVDDSGACAHGFLRVMRIISN